ncbi:hypothetical protein C5167_021153 [Papaver somniferum]|uniref:Uncharacterized protein n=1 Tax=Papaver somniferum TaxID=3469 RepID=A0A4Y7IV38_PAPSO|nr:hypothetical protein C5167_021153 [Papaver somniferum]
MGLGPDIQTLAIFAKTLRIPNFQPSSLTPPPPPPPPPPPKPAQKAVKGGCIKTLERSSYFAIREAATYYQGDAKKRAGGSTKTIVYSPNLRNKKATFALVCQTLNHLPILKGVIEGANVLNGKQKVPQYLLGYMWGKGEQCKIPCTHQPQQTCSLLVVTCALVANSGKHVIVALGHITHAHNILRVGAPLIIHDLESHHTDLKNHHPNPTVSSTGH